jgi:hypothetical protein
MGATRRLCVRAFVLAGFAGGVLSLALPGCQFPEYGIARESGGSSSGAPAAGGTTDDPAGAPGEAGTAGSEAGAAAEAGGAGGMDTAPPVACEQPCVPLPMGWQGPMAFWEAQASAPSMPLPNCPLGYENPIDLHRELIAPTACTCTCTAVNQVCDAVLHIYGDLACNTECAKVSTSTCGPISGCIGSQGSVSVDAATVSGGSCTPSIAPLPDPTWQYNERLCQSNAAGSCDAPHQVCAPTPKAPYASQLCVTRRLLEGQMTPTCPAAYPAPYKALYDTYTDTRGCSACGCGSVSGGSCTGNAMMSGGVDCSDGREFPIGTTCKTFDIGPGSVRPSHAGNQYTVVPGKCGVASPPQPTGKAEPSGSVTVVCCQAAQ